MNESPLPRALGFAGACAVVGCLAALGVFNSIFGFPIVFAAACLVLGGFEIWRRRAHGAVLTSALVLVAGAGIAVGGRVLEQRAIERSQVERRGQVLADFAGSPVPELSALEPLGGDHEAWAAAASFEAPATIVTFWARWCSPCWKEMDELEELYQEHSEAGLSVVAVTRYDTPDEAEERRSDFAKAVDFLDQRGITYPAAITDDDEIYRAYRVRGPPVAVLVDGSGRAVDYAIALDDARALMQKAVAMLPEPAL